MLKPQKEGKNRKKNVYGTASELYNELLGMHFDKYNNLSGAKRKETDVKYNPANL